MKLLRIILTLSMFVLATLLAFSANTSFYINPHGKHSTLGCIPGVLDNPWMNCLKTNSGAYCTVTVGSGFRIEHGKIAYDGNHCGIPFKVLRRPF